MTSVHADVLQPFFFCAFPEFIKDPSDQDGLRRLLRQPGWRLSRDSTKLLEAELDDVVFDFISKVRPYLCRTITSI